MLLRIPKNALIILAASILLLIILFAIIFISFFNNASNITQSPPTPTPIESNFIRGNSNIQPKNIYPIEDKTGQSIKNPSQVITLTTEQKIIPQNVKVEVKPEIPLRVRQGDSEDELNISPEPPFYWKPDILYTITVYDNQEKLITSYKIKVPLFKVPYEPL